MSRTIKILISSWPQTWKFSQLYRQKICFWPFSPSSRFGHALRPIFILWLVKIWQVSSCRKFMQHLETCLCTSQLHPRPPKPPWIVGILRSNSGANTLILHSFLALASGKLPKICSYTHLSPGWRVSWPWSVTSSLHEGCDLANFRRKLAEFERQFRHSLVKN